LFTLDAIFFADNCYTNVIFVDRSTINFMTSFVEKYKYKDIKIHKQKDEDTIMESIKIRIK